MKLVNLCAILFTLGLCITASGQNEKPIRKLGPCDLQYERTALSIVVLNKPNELNFNEVRNNLIRSIDEKYYNQNLDISFIDVAFQEEATEKDKSESIRQKLVELKVGNELIYKWYDYDGQRLSMDTIAERALYGYKQSQIPDVKHGIQGFDLLIDLGEDLINNTDVLVLDYSDIETFEAYNKRKKLDQLSEKNQEKLRKHGFRLHAKGYLFQLDLEQDWTAQIDNNWDSPEKLESLNFDFVEVGSTKEILVSVGENDARHAVSKKTNQDYIIEAQHRAIEKVLFNLTRKVKNLQVKVGLNSFEFDTNTKLKASVGLKEGIRSYQRFGVYKIIERKNGTVKHRRIATIRAIGIADNRHGYKNNTRKTQFYQESGLKRMYPGMLLKQELDFGVGFTGFYGNVNSEFYGARVDYNILQAIRPKFKKYSDLELRVQGGFTIIRGPKPVILQESLIEQDENRSTISRASVGLSVVKNWRPNLKYEVFGNYISQTLRDKDVELTENQSQMTTYEIGGRFHVVCTRYARIIISAGWSGEGFEEFNIPRTDIQSGLNANLGLRINI